MSSAADRKSNADGSEDVVGAIVAELDERARRGEMPSCGVAYWHGLRAAWLRTTESEVAKLPDSFDDAGPLQLSRGRTTPVRDLSEGEMEELEDCLDAVQRPFPRLRRSTPLMQAVQCAEGLWDSDG
ncbi:unnamed protein product [Prorocentrum cordatum]|uniref:Rab3 GTPase-activating protein catalytic subunit n=1 Tax=Prorocentrum cordatum TaxID=2364126 RepID=A0ABN9WZT1_9DINO|nr:unnamed protein product [Polarella glacialis]